MPHTASDRLDHLGDFTTTPQVLLISALALFIGVVAAYVAAGVLWLFWRFTNVFLFQRIDKTLG
jgi:CIC family chloride channel protein